MSSYGLIETTTESKGEALHWLCIETLAYTLTNINEVVLWQTALHRLAGDHLVVSDPLKPVFSAIVRLPPQMYRQENLPLCL